VLPDDELPVPVPDVPDPDVDVSVPDVPDVPEVEPLPVPVAPLVEPVPDVPEVELSVPDELGVELLVPDVSVLEVPVPEVPEDVPIPEVPEVVPDPDVPEEVLSVPEDPEVVPVPMVELPEPDVPELDVSLPDDPDVVLPVPELGMGGVLSVPELVSEDEVPVDGELLLVPELVVLSLLVPDELLPLVPDPLEELSLFGMSTVVVVVTDPDEPDVPLSEDDGVALDELVPAFEGSVVVVVVVLCPNVIVAVPISDRKIAIGNFFMLAP